MGQEFKIRINDDEYVVVAGTEAEALRTLANLLEVKIEGVNSNDKV